MELEFENKEHHCLNWNMREWQNQEQTLEVRLPDDYPDIGTILGTWGQCILRGKQWSGDEASVNGGMMIWVLYRPADGSEPRTVESWIPIQQKWEMPNCRSEGMLRTVWSVKSADARMLTPRKMMVRVCAGILAEALEPSQIRTGLPGQIPEDICLLRRDYPAMVPVEAGEKTFAIEESFSLPQETEPVQIVYCTLNPELTEQKVVANRAVFRGTAKCHLLYRCEDNRFHTADFDMEFSQLEDLQNDYGQEARVSLMMAVTAMEPELQDGRLVIKAGMSGQYLIYDRCMLSIVEDAYSPIRDVKGYTEETAVPMLLDVTRKVLEPQIQLNGGDVLDVSVTIEPPIQRRAGDLMEVEIPGAVQVLEMDTEGNLCGNSVRWSETWELPLGQNTRLDVSIPHASISNISQGGQQNKVVMDLELQGETVSSQGMPMVTAMEISEPREPDTNRPSVVLKRAGEGSVWEIAKENGSTVEAIMEANQLTQDPTDHRILLIPII